MRARMDGIDVKEQDSENRPAADTLAADIYHRPESPAARASSRRRQIPSLVPNIHKTGPTCS